MGNAGFISSTVPPSNPLLPFTQASSIQEFRTVHPPSSVQASFRSFQPNTLHPTPSIRSLQPGTFLPAGFHRDGVQWRGGGRDWVRCWMEGCGGSSRGGWMGGGWKVGRRGGGGGVEGGFSEPKTAVNRAKRNRVKTHPRNRNEPKRNAALLVA